MVPACLPYSFAYTSHISDTFYCLPIGLNIHETYNILNQLNLKEMINDSRIGMYIPDTYKARTHYDVLYFDKNMYRNSP